MGQSYAPAIPTKTKQIISAIKIFPYLILGFIVHFLNLLKFLSHIFNVALNYKN